MVSYGITFEKNNMINELHRSPEQGSDAFLFLKYGQTVCEPIMGSLLHYSTRRTYNKPIIGSFEVQFYERKAKTFVTTN